MEIKIKKDGTLMFNKNYKFVDQFCPYHRDSQCGEWCPLFYLDETKYYLYLRSSKTYKLRSIIKE